MIGKKYADIGRTFEFLSCQNVDFSICLIYELFQENDSPFNFSIVRFLAFRQIRRVKTLVVYCLMNIRT